MYLCALIERKLMANERPSIMNAAGWMALPIGFMWTASFLCTMYSAEHPLLSMLSTALGFVSIYMLYRQLKNYRRLYPSSWLHILCLSFVCCLLAGLLTDAAQYAYFLYLDNGRLLSQMGNAMQNEEYRQVLQQLMPEAKPDEVAQIIQNMSVRDIMLQLITYNALLALPISLFAALPVRAASPTSSPTGKDTNNKS